MDIEYMIKFLQTEIRADKANISMLKKKYPGHSKLISRWEKDIENNKEKIQFLKDFRSNLIKIKRRYPDIEF